MLLKSYQRLEILEDNNWYYKLSMVGKIDKILDEFIHQAMPCFMGFLVMMITERLEFPYEECNREGL